MVCWLPGIWVSGVFTKNQMIPQTYSRLLHISVAFDKEAAFLFNPPPPTPQEELLWLQWLISTWSKSQGMFLSAHCLLLSRKLSFSCIILTTVDLKANNVALSLTTFMELKSQGVFTLSSHHSHGFLLRPFPFSALSLSQRGAQI